MAESEIINIEGIGPVTLVRNPRARRIVISVRPRRGIRVSIPKHSSAKEALNFVQKKEKWIKKHQASIKEYEEKKRAANEAFSNIDKKEARKRIIARLAELAQQNGFTYRQVSVRNQRTRWGSCSGKNYISLNYKLVALPQDLFDYVIFHELVHTRVHNHSEQFWKELDKYVGSGKAKAKRLVEYGLGIL
jgi:predicted metal-dependent hydrolase